MGVDISGGIIVGAYFEDVEPNIELPEGHDDVWEYLEEIGFDSMSPYYDSYQSQWVVGFHIKDYLPHKESFDMWVEEVQRKRTTFKNITGLDAWVIGMQDVT